MLDLGWCVIKEMTPWAVKGLRVAIDKIEEAIKAKNFDSTIYSLQNAEESIRIVEKDLWWRTR